MSNIPDFILNLVSRRTAYTFQDFINKFSFCPCGFFCKDCLRLMVRDEGTFKGIFWHIVYHTILGKIYYWFELKKPEEPIKNLIPMKVYDECFEMAKEERRLWCGE